MYPKNIKNCVLIDCISYTVVSIILSVLYACSPDLTMDISSKTYLQLFCCTTLISILIYFTTKFRTESPFLVNLIVFLDVAAVIFGVGGGIFGWFPWELKYVAEVAAILTLTFFITSLIMYWQNNEIAKEINQKIKERKK